MVNNGSTHYDHDRDGTHTTIGGCEVKFRNFNHDTYLTIRYENDKLTGKLSNGVNTGDPKNIYFCSLP